MDRIGLVGARQQHRLGQGEGRVHGRDHAQDARLAVHRGDLNRVVRRPEAHLVEGEGRRDVHEPEPGRLGPVQRDHALHDAGLRLRQEPALLAEGHAEDRVPRVRAGGVERRGARADPERPGRLDAQLRPERREGVRSRRTRQHYHAFYANRATRSRSSSTTRSTRTASSAFRKALSLAIDRNSVSKLGEYGYEPPTDAIGLNGLFPKWVTDPAVKALAKAMATYNPAAAKKMLTDAGFTYKGSKLHRPEGQPGQARHPRDLGLVGLGRLEPDHHEEPAGRSASTRTSRSSPTGATGSRTRSRRRTRRCSGRSARGARRTATSTRTSRRTRSSRRAQDATPTGNWEHFSNAKATTLLNQWKGTLDAKKQQAIATQLEKIWLQQLPIIPLFIGAALVDVQHEVLPLLRRRRRTSTATRSSRRIPTTSSRSPGSARAGRPGRRSPPRPLRRRRAGLPRPARRSYARGARHALVRPPPRLLRLRALGRADDQLPAAAADARQTRSRGLLAAPEPGAAPGEPRASSRPTRRCSAAATTRSGRTTSRTSHRIVHFDFGISTSNYPTPVSEVVGRTLPYSIFLVGVAFLLAFVVGTRDRHDRRVAPRRRRRQRRRPDVHGARRVPRLLHRAARRSTSSGSRRGWFPIQHAYDSEPDPGLQLGVPLERVPPRAAADPRDHRSPSPAAGC